MKTLKVLFYIFLCVLLGVSILGFITIAVRGVSTSDYLTNTQLKVE